MRVGVADRIARAAAIILLLGSAVLGVWSCRGVFADGSYYLWTLLTTGEPFGYPSRAIAQAVMQFPVTAAVHLGVTDLPTILRLQSLGSIGIPAVIWAAALVALRRDRAFWPMAVVAAVAVGTTSFMAVGEYNLAYAMVGASAALLLRDRPVTRTGQAALVALALGMLFSYESLIVLLPLLAVLVMVRIRLLWSTGHRWRTLWPFGVVLLIYGVAAAICAWYIRFPRDPRNLGTAADLLLPLARSEQLRLTLVAAVLLILAWAIRASWMRVIAGGLATATAVAVLVRPVGWSTPGLHYDARALIAIMMLGLLALVAIGVFRARRPESAGHPIPRTATAIGTGALLFALILPLGMRTVEFAGWLAAVDRTVSRSGDAVPVDLAGLPAAETALFSWDWTSPYLSRLLGGPDGVVLLPPGTPVDSPVPAPVPSRFDTSPPIFLGR